jgi:hypothetical protein
VNDILLIVLVIALGFGGLFGFIVLLERRRKVQEQSGKPSLLIRISAIVVGLAGIGALLWLEVGLPWYVLPLSLVLLAYGFFGWFVAVKPRQDKVRQETIEASDNANPPPTDP